jgi:superfamily II DNA or RNA helicase
MGPIYKVISTAELMAAGQVSPLEIKCLILKYPEYVRKAMKGMDYKEEVSFLIANDIRNKFIADLAVNCSGNTLVLFNFVERHGSVLYELVKSQTDRPVYYIHGGVDNEERENIRKIVETQDNAIMLATSSLMSTGTNIPSIRNIIFAIPSKSTIRVRQSIGRGLRLKKGKDKCILFDISDDLKYKAYTNTTWKHMEDRLAIYSKESFSFSIRELQLPYTKQ